MEKGENKKRQVRLDDILAGTASEEEGKKEDDVSCRKREDNEKRVAPEHENEMLRRWARKA